MLNKKFFAAIKSKTLLYAAKRREVIKIAGDAQHHAKRAIFALHRGDTPSAKASLGAALKLLKSVQKEFRHDEHLSEEGSYRAALEEYTEAVLFEQFLEGKAIGEVLAIDVPSDVYISGLCDVPGEIVRFGIKSATERDFKAVKGAKVAAEEVIAALIDMDLTGYNRQKFDQAKQAFHKLEQIVYEVSLKNP